MRVRTSALMLAIGFLLTNCYHTEYGGEAPPADAPSADASVTPGPHTLVVELDQNYLGACAGGWVTIVYGSDGLPFDSLPGVALRVETNPASAGFAMVGARCGIDRYYVWSPNLQNHPVSEGGVVRISLGTTDLTRGGALICLDPYFAPYITRPTVPFGTRNYFHCPLHY